MDATGIQTIWEDNSPPPLVDLSIRCLLHNPATLFYAIDVTRVRRRRTASLSSGVLRSPSWEVVEHEEQISKKGKTIIEYRNTEW